MTTMMPGWSNGKSWLTSVSGEYSVYVIHDGKQVLGVAGTRKGFDKFICELFDTLAKTRLHHGGKVPKGTPPWMRRRPVPFVLVTRIDSRKCGLVSTKRYLIALGQDYRLRIVPPLVQRKRNFMQVIEKAGRKGTPYC